MLVKPIASLSIVLVCTLFALTSAGTTDWLDKTSGMFHHAIDAASRHLHWGEGTEKQEISEDGPRCAVPYCHALFVKLNNEDLGTDEVLVELEMFKPRIGSGFVLEGVLLDDILNYKETECELENDEFFTSKYPECKYSEEESCQSAGINNFINDKVKKRKESCLEKVRPQLEAALSNADEQDKKLLGNFVFSKTNRPINIKASVQRFLSESNLELQDKRIQFGGSCNRLMETLGSIMKKTRLDLLPRHDEFVDQWLKIQKICHNINLLVNIPEPEETTNSDEVE